MSTAYRISVPSIAVFGIIALLLLSSCSSLSMGEKKTSRKETDEKAAQEARSEIDGTADTQREERIPAQEISGGIDVASASFRENLYTLPENGELVFLAIVPRRADRKEEYEFALWEIARQGAIYEQVAISAQFLTAQTTAEFGHDERITVDVDENLIEQMRDRVVAREHYRDSRRTVVRGTIEELSSRNYRIDTSVKGGLPVWVLNPLKIEGRYTTVGSAEKRYYLSDSIRAADKKAMANLARQRRLKIDNLSDQVKSNAGEAYREFNLELTEAKLEGFYVLARWFSPEENLFYTLAICSRAE